MPGDLKLSDLKVKSLMAKLYTEEGDWVCDLVDYPGLIGVGATPGEALGVAINFIEGWEEAAEERRQKRLEVQNGGTPLPDLLRGKRQ